jgi:hypothetical protein
MPSLHYEDMKDQGTSDAVALEMHLAHNFYPPIPEAVKRIFINAFHSYWEGSTDMEGLEKEVAQVYRGSLYDYGFENFLREDDY